MNNRLSRRKFLRQTTFGTLALSTARLIPYPVAQIPSGFTTAQLQYFSMYELLIIQSVAERIVGPDGPNATAASKITVALRADRFLATADLEVQDQFHQLLTVFNAPFFTFLFDFRFSSFLGMKPEDQDSYLEDWMTSSLSFRRTGFQALKRVCLSMHYTDPQSWKEIGFDGMVPS